MHAAGFETPVLQHEVRDERGLVGYSDYYWHTARIAGEFDGVDKYMKPAPPSCSVSAVKVLHDAQMPRR